VPVGSPLRSPELAKVVRASAEGSPDTKDRADGSTGVGWRLLDLHSRIFEPRFHTRLSAPAQVRTLRTARPRRVSHRARGGGSLRLPRSGSCLPPRGQSSRRERQQPARLHDREPGRAVAGESSGRGAAAGMGPTDDSAPRRTRRRRTLTPGLHGHPLRRARALAKVRARVVCSTTKSSQRRCDSHPPVAVRLVRAKRESS
jgi:hypothetical protein